MCFPNLTHYVFVFGNLVDLYLFLFILWSFFYYKKLESKFGQNADIKMTERRQKEEINFRNGKSTYLPKRKEGRDFYPENSNCAMKLYLPNFLTHLLIFVGFMEEAANLRSWRGSQRFFLFETRKTKQTSLSLIIIINFYLVKFFPLKHQSVITWSISPNF